MKVQIEDKFLLELIWMARRYADGRSTWTPGDFNTIYENIRLDYPELIATERVDRTITYFPYAQDGMFDVETGMFDARPACRDV